MTFWRQLYLDDSLFELPEWHDGFVYDLIRRTFEDQGKFKTRDIAALCSSPAILSLTAFSVTLWITLKAMSVKGRQVVCGRFIKTTAD